MSFDGYKTVIAEGDDVILYLTINQVYAVRAEAKTLSKKGVEVDNVFQTPYGALRCGDLIGKPFGAKITLSKGWGYVMQPTPELWTQTLPHRTQIIYTPDISMILLQLDITPGSIVVESGTGSGSLSHALIRAVKPNGRLYTFDFHEARVQTAHEEFTRHGLGDFVTANHRDVCSNGFGDDLTEKADAIFLDLPHPWLAIPHAVHIFKPEGGRICSFSPCIEQVQKTCLELQRLGFQELETMEVIQTSYNIQVKRLPILNLEFLKSEKDENEVGNKEREIWKGVVTTAPATMPGHTGYLTFATLPPVWARNLQISLNQVEEEDAD